MYMSRELFIIVVGGVLVSHFFRRRNVMGVRLTGLIAGTACWWPCIKDVVSVEGASVLVRIMCVVVLMSGGIAAYCLLPLWMAIVTTLWEGMDAKAEALLRKYFG